MDQGPHSRDHSTRGLPRHESCFCWCPFMSVIISTSTIHLVTCADFFSGRDYDYQTMNLTYTTNVVKSAIIIGFFPKPLKPCVVSSNRVSLSLKSTLVSFHECYRAFTHRFDKRLILLDPWSRNGLRRRRSTGRTGMISRFVRPLHLVPYLTANLQNDLLMWLMSEAKGVERSVEGLARRLLLANFVAIHSTSSASDRIPSL